MTQNRETDSGQDEQGAPAPTGYTREGVIAWLLTNSLEGVNPRVASRIYANAGQRRKNGRPA